jgi:hypothetical protein
MRLFALVEEFHARVESHNEGIIELRRPGQDNHSLEPSSTDERAGKRDLQVE